MDAEALVGDLIAMREALTDEGGNLNWPYFYRVALQVILGDEDEEVQLVAIRFLFDSLFEYACRNFPILMSIIRSRESPFHANGYRDAYRVMAVEGNCWEFLFGYFPGIHRFFRALWLPDVRLARAQVMYGWYLDIELLWRARDVIQLTVLFLWSHEERTYNMDYLAAIDQARLLQLVNFCEEAPDSRETNRRLFRILLIALILEAVAIRTPEMFLTRFVECVRLFFRATPEPHVTVQEVQEFLRSILREEDYDVVAGGLIEKFERHFPVRSRARNLMDLARYSVRRAIMRSGPNVFPDAAGRLPISRYLRSFIIGE